MQPMSTSLCGAIANNFRLPNFCRCAEAPLGGELTCRIGIANIIEIGASASVLPCGRPGSFGYSAWAAVLGMRRVRLTHRSLRIYISSFQSHVTQSVGRTWRGAFQINMDIPGAGFSLVVARLKARAELSGRVSGGVITAGLNIGACGCVGFLWWDLACHCNPTKYLPVRVIQGRFDFSHLCRA